MTGMSGLGRAAVPGLTISKVQIGENKCANTVGLAFELLYTSSAVEIANSLG